MLAFTLVLGSYALTLRLGPVAPVDEEPADYADVTSADLTRAFPVGFTAPDYDEEDRHA